MTPKQILALIYLFTVIGRFPRIKERWPAPLLRGPAWFFGVPVPPGFLDGPGRAILRNYRIRLFIPWMVEIPLLAALLAAGYPQAVLIVVFVITLLTRLNYYAARQTAENSARAFATPSVSEAPSSVVLSLQPRTLASYTNPWIESLIVLLVGVPLAWLIYKHVTGWILTWTVIVIYLQAGLLLVKRGIVRARTAAPADNPEQYLVWRESLRRLATNNCDLIRILLALSPLATASRLAGEAVQLTAAGILLAATAILSWYEWRRRDQHLKVTRALKPANLLVRPDIAEASSFICFRPALSALLLRSSNGYTVNLASAPVRAAVLYIVGFAGLLTLFPLLHAQTTGIAGEWTGIIAGKLHVVVRIDRTPDKSYKGILESPDQGNIKIDIDQVAFDGKATVHLDLKNIGASYDGELNPTASEINGIWQQGGSRVPLILRHPGAASATLKPVTRGRVAFKPCTAADSSTQALCGTYDVYENRATRAGRKISLNVVILPALAEKSAADPIFAFAGGPGQSASRAYPFATYVTLLRKQRDVVLIDQRGTGKSNPLQCPFDPKDVQLLMNGPFSPPSVPACRAELEKIADLTQYTTANAVDDADEVREALGYEKIDVLGGSYGSLAALIYLRRHENHVRAMVVQGVVPPDYRMPLAFAATIQASLNRVFAGSPNVKQEFEATLKRLDREPVKVETKDGPVTLTRGAFVSNMRTLLYQPGVVTQLPAILHRAYENDYSPYVTVSIATHRAIGDDLARGLSFSVNCSESVPFITEADIHKETDGTYLGDYDVRIYQKNCSQWPHAKLSADILAPVHSDVPVLLISGEGDPATPPRLAEHAASALTHSRVVAIPNGTHLTASADIDKMIVQFITTGQIP